VSSRKAVAVVGKREVPARRKRRWRLRASAGRSRGEPESELERIAEERIGSIA
jgi:hypothetical protein